MIGITTFTSVHNVVVVLYFARMVLKKSADGVMSKISAPFWSNGYLTATPVSSSISSSRSSKVSRVARQDFIRSVYRRHFTFAGKYFPKLFCAKELDYEMLFDWNNYFPLYSQFPAIKDKKWIILFYCACYIIYIYYMLVREI
jgi:hypothetical protein